LCLVVVEFYSMRFFAMDDIEWNSTSIAQETRCAGWVAPMLRPYINSRNRRIVSISSTDLSGRKLTMLKFYLSNAPATCSRAERVRVRGLR